ncbi:MAG: hypothetical protein K8I30_21105 [Anaerolineae bacterium]|nr:hypothetical protein [Anaerolineae bacterium]
MEGFPIYRHWHPASERYTGGDSLLTALQFGWTIDVVTLQEYRLGGDRTSTIYYFRLKRRDETVVMPVIASPYVTRLFAQSQSRIWEYEPLLIELDDQVRTGSD